MQKAEGAGRETAGGMVPGLPSAFRLLPTRLSHALAHACVCLFILCAWAMPGGLKGPPGPAAAALSEAEADAALRRAAESALGGRAGVVLVLDAQTGRIRASAGGRLAFAEATPPGSAVKPFTALAALEAGALDPESRHACRGRYERDGLRINCSHPRYRTRFDARSALANSCNDFFGRTAETLGGAAYARKLEAFGFGAPTGGAGGDEETAGALPREGLRVAEMLGESERLRVTPAQLVTAYAALFNGGRLLVPSRARPENFAPQERARLHVEAAHRALLLEGMRGAVSYGTASRAGLSTMPVRVFGKTGTSTPPEGFRPQGWFVGLAADAGAAEVPPESVRLAVLVFLRRGHGSDAAAVARPVLAEYARTLARGREVAAGGAGSVDVEDGADANDAAASAGGGGPVVRVRLAREDTTLALGLEDYVFGVLAAEGSVEGELEALKALAVVSRTYAVRNLRRHAGEPFDLCDTTHCQRFAPVRDEGARPDFYELARRAVRETAGELLRDGAGRVAESYFSASCGGSTADIRTLWGARDAPAHLRGRPDAACSTEPHAWADAVSAEDLLRAVRADRRSDVGAHLDSVRVLRRDASGRAESVELAGERRRVLRGWDFKIIVGRTLGWSVLKSSRFEVTRAGGRFVFRGRGFGHGLGLCQAGAHQLAARGAGYKQILAHYLPGVGAAKTEARAAAADVSPEGSESRDSTQRVHGGAGGAGRTVPTVSPAPSVSRTAAGYVRPAAYAEPATVSPQSATLSSEHFRLGYPAGVARREAESVLRALEAAHADLSRRLGRASAGGPALDGVEVFAHATTGDFVGATGQPPWVAAVTSGRRVDLQPLDTLRRRGVLASVLRHELAHVACELLGRGRAPRWLVEGLAAHFAGEGASLVRSSERLRLSPEELERRLARPGSPAEMRALYAAAYREVAALIRREGEAGAWRRVVGG